MGILLSDKRKLIIIQRNLYHYRSVLYEELGKDFALTVIHTNDHEIKTPNYECLKVKSLNFFGLFIHCYIPPIQDRDTTIMIECNIRVLLLWFLLASKYVARQRNIILWGNQLSSSSVISALRRWIVSLRLKHLFYSEKIALDMCGDSLNPKFHFWYNNTVKVPRRESICKKSSSVFLNVGGCQERKRHEVVLRSIVILKDLFPDIRYVIIGNTDNAGNLFKEAERLGVSESLMVHDSIHNEEELAQIYDEALASVCYGQAGLTVLQSLGNGTPVIVGANAISGGESEAIIDGFNGLIVNSESELTEAMLKLISSNSYLCKLSKNALKSYRELHSFESMLHKFKEVIIADTY